jgi:tol-pal system protein YbgF
MALALRSRLTLLGSLLLALSAPVRAGLFDDDVARQRIQRLSDEVAQLSTDASRRLEDAQKNQLDFINQMEAVKADIARLRGQVEELTYNLDAAQKRQKDFYFDLDNRLRKLESSGEKPDEAAAPPAADPQAESRDYEAALTSLKGGKYKEAVASFLAFIKAYPNSSLLPSAHFWTGYGYAHNREPQKAAEMYGKLVATWPKDARAPDALAEQASALEAAGDKAGARRALEALQEKYPSSEAARQQKPAKRK